MTCDFTFKHYGEIIQKALDNDYSFYTFSEYLNKRPKGKSMLLRHDIDNHFYRTGEFAKIERKLKVKGTYFFRVHTNYNIFEYNNYAAIADLEKQGHEIGLHSEIGDFEKFNPGADYLELLKREKLYLEACVGKKINGFSTHRDFDYSVNSLDIIRKINWKSLGFTYEAYQDEFHKDIKYVSEAVNGHIGWRDKCPCQYIEGGESMSILAHPAWWYHKHPREGE